MNQNKHRQKTLQMDLEVGFIMKPRNPPMTNHVMQNTIFILSFVSVFLGIFYSFLLSHFGLPAILILVGEVFEYSGICEKLSFSTIEFEMWAVNCLTCFLMYFRNASDFHRPMSCIVYVGICGCAKYIAIAPPACIE